MMTTTVRNMMMVTMMEIMTMMTMMMMTTTMRTMVIAWHYERDLAWWGWGEGEHRV
jgi:hypothetical protein